MNFLFIIKSFCLILFFYLLYKSKENFINFDEKISVIIPTYNREKTIIPSINSVLKQTYHNLEVLIIDDGSNDNTESLISNIKDSRIKYLKIKKNKGACFARNLGIKMSTGKYITFQDSDDYYHINKIEKQYLNLIKKKSDFDFCRFCIHFNNSYEIILPKVKQQKKIKRKKILEELCNGNFITTQSILVKRIFIKQILFDINFPRFQDYDLILMF